MIHTQYYALMRGIAAALQKATPHTKINQWDFNYNSKTFDSLKMHRNPLPYPKGIINITNSQKQFIYPLTQNLSVGMNAADLVQFPNAFPIASVLDKYEIYGLTNRYNIGVDVTINFETSAQMLDFFHNYSEYFPHEGKSFYDFEYDYFLYLPPEILNDYDPAVDNAINIFAQMKDDSSNFDLFAKCMSTPILKCENINMNQDKESDTHSINISFTVQDSFLYSIMVIDADYWVRALSLSIIIKIADFSGEETEVAHYGPRKLMREAYPDFAGDATREQVGDNLKTNNETNNDTTIKKAT